MKKYLIQFVALVTTLITTQTYADCYTQDFCCDSGRTYISAVAGANFLSSDKIESRHVKFHPGYMGAVAVGYKYQAFAGELEVGYRWNKMKKLHYGEYSLPINVHADTLSVMANVVYDIELDTCFTPYVGVGIGYARLNIHATAKHNAFGSNISLKSDADKFAYQGIAGVRTRICDDTDLGIEYRYFGLAQSGKIENQQNIGVSVRHFF